MTLIAVIAAGLALVLQDGIRPEVAGVRRWAIAHEQQNALVAFTETRRDGDSREVWLITTARVADAGADPTILQRYFIHTIDCTEWTQTRAGFGLTDPPPQAWTPMDGPPPPTPIHPAEPIVAGSPIELIARISCHDEAATLPELRGHWTEVAAGLRSRMKPTG